MSGRHLETPVNKPISSEDWLRAIAEKVETEGPQTIAVGGHGRLTVVAEEDYLRLASRKPTFLEALQGLGDLGDIDLKRDRSPARETEL